MRLPLHHILLEHERRKLSPNALEPNGSFNALEPKVVGVGGGRRERRAGGGRDGAARAGAAARRASHDGLDTERRDTLTMHTTVAERYRALGGAHDAVQSLESGSKSPAYEPEEFYV